MTILKEFILETVVHLQGKQDLNRWWTSKVQGLGHSLSSQPETLRHPRSISQRPAEDHKSPTSICHAEQLNMRLYLCQLGIFIPEADFASLPVSPQPRRDQKQQHQIREEVGITDNLEMIPRPMQV